MISNSKKEGTDMIDQFFSDRLTLERLHFGPLGDHIDRFAQVLSAQGYTRLTAKAKIGAVAGLSRWLHKRGLGVEALDEQTISKFLRYCRRRGLCRCHTAHTLQDLLKHLRDGGIVREVAAVEKSALYDVEEEFAQYLRHERGLIQASADNYIRTARRFLSECFGNEPLALNELDPKQVVRFMARRSKGMGPRSLQLMAIALRSFFRFLYQRGELVRDLAAAVPKVANWRLSELPKFLEPEHIERLLKACPQDTPLGQRDYAILLLLARLGLRPGEVAHLELDDIDWERGEITVRGKSAWHARLPIPWDVGEALARYLGQSRHRCPSRRVFLRMMAPRKGFADSTAIGEVVERALARAGLPVRKRSYLLRHGLATRMLRGGASLAEIGEILRHKLPSTTEIYAKVDVASLRALALPWKGGAR
jgi:site-specific recombinase XerD